ncbi:DNA recombination/repair protein RecA/RadB, ATP-binding domain protein [Ophiocordyceps sinensis CO18]|uniref:DNA recombination/repair protein RecA/RadB, ATP-binding domain protein n=1 Tax=Ophiocordyceps sinensis (strain Co18 / CGMCC 3.14243) TaxID=911162 RepID=T5AIJ3_OPHSC|nr:DNA recombination/repair protein RecA/RadB, ATP-binding domain protein [Ophiocordyceps sinensis CO18]
MDYHSIHGQDISSFDIPDTHRLPTIAASQALEELQHEPALSLSTGLESLDMALDGSVGIVSGDSRLPGGVKRGQVTEIWGPPGSGKTALAYGSPAPPQGPGRMADAQACRIQTAAHAICHGHDVVWVDCFQMVNKQRIVRVVESVSKSHVSNHDLAMDWTKFTHFSCLTLPHLMALVSRPTTNTIGATVSLVVISSVSSLLNSAFPKSQPGKTGPKAGKGLSASAKRVQGLQFVINALQKLAATRNCAVMILSQCATRMHSEQGATLVPAVNASVWEQGVATRLVLFRDWAWQGKQLASGFMVALQKLDGKATNDVVARMAAFDVEPSGAAEMDCDGSGSPSAEPADLVVLLPRKRKLAHTELEIPDSEDEADDEDYGWADEEAAKNSLPFTS